MLLLLLAEDPAHYVLIGSGSGLAPYRAMLPEFAYRTAGTDLRVTIVMGVRSPREAFCLHAFTRPTAVYPLRRHLHVRYSRELPTSPKRGEGRGYAQERSPALDLSPSYTMAYLCGNPGMIDAAAG
ncbi:hypothetical protein [Sediminicurvatus halobius]|uniref:Oxidoreductase FAD/NAD(P)-binding domain-containing protein n=1 Tax=Sediminicurvatus halobius TaxID=2182432 RepID=A0A2U2MWZ2_9GAMM|nr:hypothetical protein [Spiribacter halobius]PWG61381.1 hypothetical protein DEM34_16830 [Spiribacter halobius]UEX76594.1 hypothetical protein LMH63_11565 [Spiribacter halobius]